MATTETTKTIIPHVSTETITQRGKTFRHKTFRLLREPDVRGSLWKPFQRMAKNADCV